MVTYTERLDMPAEMLNEGVNGTGTARLIGEGDILQSTITTALTPHVTSS